MNKFNWKELNCTSEDKVKILSIVCALLVGIIWGFMISPIKKGIYCGNNNDNNYKDCCKDDKWSIDE